MKQTRVTLPVRLLPRKRALVFHLCFFTFFFGFSIFWTLMAAKKSVHVEFNGVPVTDPHWRALFPLWGIPFIAVGLGGLGWTLLKMLPGGPYFHLDLSTDGLIVRGIVRQRSFAWRDLPQLTMKVDRDPESGPFHYMVATDGLTRSGKPREILCIPMNQYGTKNSEQGAAELAAWLNRFRDLALQGQLSTNTDLEVPEGFARNLVSAAMSKRSGLMRSM